MNEKTDNFYDYRKFPDERAHGIFAGWDGLGGNHGFVLKRCAELLKGKTVLDVGCGLCHMYELIKDRVDEYVGIDIDPRIIEWATERYPALNLQVADVYDLTSIDKFDTVYAIGLYRRINETKGIEEMLKHTKEALVLTYLHRGAEPDYFPDPLWKFVRGDVVKSTEIISNRIIGTELLRLNL